MDNLVFRVVWQVILRMQGNMWTKAKLAPLGAVTKPVMKLLQQSFPFSQRTTTNRVKLWGSYVTCPNIQLQLSDFSVWDRFVPNWHRIECTELHGDMFITHLQKLTLKYNLVTSGLFLTFSYKSWKRMKPGSFTDVTGECFLLYGY
eukprot:TRINITY_DN3035_c0_g2_i1.p1 TRINITY_DN3035_c0_g2~~TRINITY_DN3035_c0_g2_i1.p1  ORF type:complete len:146 (-),score=12.52 TRINITY_DN3035_c0_g2_i1:202-639(-)